MRDPDPGWAGPPHRRLVLGVPAGGDTRAPDGRSGSSCRQGGRGGQYLDHLYGFEVRRAASYRFELSPEFLGVVEVQQKNPDHPNYSGIGCRAAKPDGRAVLSLPLEPGFYRVVVDGYDADQAGRYALRVDVDGSRDAALRSEDPAVAALACRQATPLSVGTHTLGMFRSRPGGVRAGCGLTGGTSVHRLTLAQPARIRLRAAAHFVPAVEVRRGCAGPRVACARATPGAYATELATRLDPGEWLVVIDAAALAPRDPYGPRLEGAGVLGAYVIEVEEVPE
jgi:hypothetical protein